MIGRTILGQSFLGCVRYVMEKPKAEVLHAQHVRSYSAERAASDMEAIRKLRPGLRNVVWHTSLSFANQDQVSDDLMQKVAKYYLEKARFGNLNQYIIVKHQDRMHPHVHIVANRIDYNGNAVSDQFYKNRTAQICDEIEQRFGLTIAREQQRALQHEHPAWLQEAISKKEKIRKAINEHMTQKAKVSWRSLHDDLRKQGIQLRITRNKEGKVVGISFHTEDFSIKGSKLGKGYTFPSLNRVFLQQGIEEKLSNEKAQKTKRKLSL